MDNTWNSHGSTEKPRAGTLGNDRSKDELWMVSIDRLWILRREDFDFRAWESAEATLIGNSIVSSGFDPKSYLRCSVTTDKEWAEPRLLVMDGVTRLKAVDIANGRGAGIRSLPVMVCPAGEVSGTMAGLEPKHAEEVRFVMESVLRA